MKVLILNGSPRANGNTSIAVKELVKTFETEGVETEEELKMLKEAGCDIIQGYYFSKPIPPEEMSRFV